MAFHKDDKRNFEEAAVCHICSGTFLCGLVPTLPVGVDLLIGNDLCPDIPCLLYTSPSPRDRQKSRMPSSA